MRNIIIITALMLSACNYKVKLNAKRIDIVKDTTIVLPPLTDAEKSDTLIAGLLRLRPANKTKQKCDYIMHFIMLLGLLNYQPNKPITMSNYKFTQPVSMHGLFIEPKKD